MGVSVSFTHDQLAFVFGLLGTAISFLVFLAPVPTFYTIWKRKSSEGFQSIPYVVALSSAMLLLYYGSLKTDASMIIIINAIGCGIELTYLALYVFFALNKDRKSTMKSVLVFNILGYVLIIGLTLLLTKGPSRVAAVGWICAVYNILVFAAPLSIMNQVIKTKSVEFMPFTLSFFLTLCAIAWFFYGFFVKDYFIALPNVLGFLFGITQMILYMVYVNSNNGTDEEFDVEKPKQDGEFIKPEVIMATVHNTKSVDDGSGAPANGARKRSMESGNHEAKYAEMCQYNYNK